MIWGEAGVGKTTFCHTFCNDWGLVVKEKEGKGQELTKVQKSKLEKLTEEQKSKLNNIGLLIFIVLRDIDVHTKTVKDIIISQLGLQKEGTYLSQTGLKEQLLSIFVNVNVPRKLVLVTDGFDELAEQNETIEEVITGRSYQNILSITTCRPHATQAIDLEVDVEIWLKGFSRKETITYVENYAKVKYSKQNEIESFVSRTMNQIKSSAYLLEMSTNPSMLQLLCLFSWKKTTNFGKDRTSVFKYYTNYLLRQYHIKLVIKEKLAKTKRYSDNLYHQNLLDAGKVALMGLKQNKLVFSEEEAYQTGGDAIFEIGFMTKLPNTDIDSVKVQFTHMTLQEYLAAFYVVNTSFHEGLEILMEFCSTSERLMASKIILEFVSNMSPELEAEIQKLIKDVVLGWDTDKRRNSKSCTSFLISMLEGTETLKFPLPAVIEIDFRYNYFKKPALERLFSMDGKGVRKIDLILDQTNRLNVLQNTKVDSLDELNIANDWWSKSWSKVCNKEMYGVMKKMKPGLLSITNCEWKSMDKDTIDVILQHVHTLILENCDLGQEHLLSILRAEHHLRVLKATDRGVKIDGELIEAVSKLPSDINLNMFGQMITLVHKVDSIKSLSICNHGVSLEIDTEVAESVSRLPDHTQLDLSGNQVSDKSACIALIHKAATMNSISICNCFIQIDTEIAEAVSRLPDHTQLDLSGNQVTDKSACITLIHKAANMKSLNIRNCMSNCGIKIDTEIAEAVSRLPDHTQLDLSGNQVTDKSACITLIRQAAIMKSLKIHDCMSNCGIQIDTEIAEAVSRLPDHTELDISGNQVTEKSACIILIDKAVTMKSLNIHNCISNCGIEIDAGLAEAISRLPNDTHLDLSGNHVTDKSACIILIHKAATMKSLNIHNCISNCGIQIDTEIAEAVSRLPDHTELDLSGNQATDKSTCIALINMGANLKFLSICNCGIQIDTEVAEAVSRLSDQTQLDLSGNKVTDKSACVTLMHKAANMKSLRLCNCGIHIDTEIAEAVSRLSEHTELDLSGNQVTDKSACVTLMHKAANMKSLKICNCGIQIDTEVAEAVSRLSDHTDLDLSGNWVTDKSACVTLMHKAANMKYLKICNCGIQIDTEVAEAVSRLSDHTDLDLSGNWVTDKSAFVTLMHKVATLKSLSISNCGIKIDTKIAEAVSQQPDNIQLNLSGNRLTKMNPGLLPGVLLHMPKEKEIGMSGWGITIDVDIVRALSKMPQLKSLKASCNKFTPEAAREFSVSQLQEINLFRCGINDTVCVSLMISLSKHCPLLEVLGLDYNNLTSDEWCHHVQMKKLRKLYLSTCGINDTVCVSLMTSLSKHCSRLEVLDLKCNNLISDEWCHHVQMNKLRVLDLFNCGICDTVYVSLMSSLSKHCLLLEVLNLSNKHSQYYYSLTSDKWCHHVQMKQLRELYLSNCGIADTVCVSLMSSLSKHCPMLEILKLDDNKLTSDEWCHHEQMKQLKELYLSNCGIADTVCVSLMINLSKYCPLLEVLKLSRNKLISDEWCLHVQMKKLSELDLSNCGMNDTVCVSLIISLSKHCPLLEVLNLGFNRLTSSSDVWEIVDHIKHMEKLRELSLNPFVNYQQIFAWDQLCMEDIKKTLQKSNPGLKIDTGCREGLHFHSYFI